MVPTLLERHVFNKNEITFHFCLTCNFYKTAAALYGKICLEVGLINAAQPIGTLQKKIRKLAS